MMEDNDNKELNDKLDEAVKEAIDDDTFRKVQRVSYQTHGLDDASIFKTISINIKYLIKSGESLINQSELASSESVDVVQNDTSSS
jgi:hypothetical protein